MATSNWLITLKEKGSYLGQIQKLVLQLEKILNNFNLILQGYKNN